MGGARKRTGEIRGRGRERELREERGDGMAEGRSGAGGRAGCIGGTGTALIGPCRKCLARCWGWNAPRRRRRTGRGETIAALIGLAGAMTGSLVLQSEARAGMRVAELMTGWVRRRWTRRRGTRWGRWGIWWRGRGRGTIPCWPRNACFRRRRSWWGRGMSCFSRKATIQINRAYRSRVPVHGFGGVPAGGVKGGGRWSVACGLWPVAGRVPEAAGDGNLGCCEALEGAGQLISDLAFGRFVEGFRAVQRLVAGTNGVYREKFWLPSVCQSASTVRDPQSFDELDLRGRAAKFVGA